jgi:hypothetical protein
MTTYSTSFDSYTADVQPSDWTARWVTTSQNYLTRSKAGTEGGKVLEHTGSSSAKHLVTWDAVDADANRANVEILARVRPSGSSVELPRLTVRGSGASGAENGYLLLFSTSGVNYQLQKFVSGASTNLGSAVSFSPAANTWYYIRLRVNGTSLQARVWKDGENEPSTWSVSATDSAVSAAGWVGIGNQDPTGTRDIDWFSVGTNGDTAPLTTNTANSIRVSQAVSEVVHATVAPARVSQVVSEVVHHSVAPARISQLVTEVAISAPIAGQVSQMVVEVAFSNAVAVTQQPRMIVLM